jgi:hypothetical protein
MQDVARVREIEGVAHSDDDAQTAQQFTCCALVRRSAGQSIAEPLPGQQFHGVEAAALGVDARVMHRHDVWVLQGSQQPGLLANQLGQVSLQGACVLQSLQGHVPVEFTVVGLEDRGCPAFPGQ